MKKNILILGSTGLIGHQVYTYLNSSDQYKMFNISFRKKFTRDTILLDVRNEKKLIENISLINPDIIVNCIGVLIKGSNENPEDAIFINSYIPHRLMRHANLLKAKLIQITTDCVFSGRKKTPYIENDEKDGLDVYAKSKGLGEIINGKHLTLRTSVVGPEIKRNGYELFHWFMNQTVSINGYTNAIWSGVTTLELAKAVKWAIDENITGLYHITNGESISKYDLLKLFQKYTKKNILIKAVEGRDVDKSFIDTRQIINYQIPSYDTMVRDMVNLIATSSIYDVYHINDKQ
jgi:dTDP-4-dehydrorhamnose reductase